MKSRRDAPPFSPVSMNRTTTGVPPIASRSSRVQSPICSILMCVSRGAASRARYGLDDGSRRSGQRSDRRFAFSVPRREVVYCRLSVEKDGSMNAPEPGDELFRLAVESAPNSMILVDEAGRIVLVNAQTEKVFGYSRAELLGEPIEKLVPERFRAAHPGQRRSFFADPRARSMGAGRDLYGLRKDGTEIPVEIGLNPLRTAQGAFV